MAFSYTNLHYFDKTGTELPLNYNSNIKIVIPNEHKDHARFFGVTNLTRPNPITQTAATPKLVDFLKISSGGRYNSDETKSAIIYSTSGNRTVDVSCNLVKQVSTDYNTYYIDTLNVKNLESLNIPNSDITYPSITFATNLTFDKVSTELYETQSIYIFLETTEENGNTVFDTVFNIVNNKPINDTAFQINSEIDNISIWAKRFKLMFFIDCREQTDFKFFTCENSQVVWTDRIFIDLLDASNGYRVDIGFSGENEGVYEQKLYLCIIDTETATENDPGMAYPVGEFSLYAETEGEDERYRTLFTNFGIPDPILYNDIFNGQDNLDDKIDYQLLNQNSKKIFLTYSEIFPYIGTYKALINAIKVLGYDDIFFKEWYKEIGNTRNDQAGYVSYDMVYHADNNAQTINNLGLEERVQLKKLNWISMMYHLNEELTSAGIDKYGFPAVVKTHNYYNTHNLIKLISVRKWLEKYIIGLNCRIIDVGGEGIYFERYKLNTYGSYQQIFEFGQSKNLAPIIENDHNIIIDGSANIVVSIDHQGSNTTFEDLKHITYEDFCTGYLQMNSSNNYYYHAKPINLQDDESLLYIGKNFNNFEDNNRYQINAQVQTQNFMFNEDFVDSNSPYLRVHNNQIEFNNVDLLKYDCNSAFTNLPIIQIERADIKYITKDINPVTKYKIYPDLQEETSSSYFIFDTETKQKVSTTDYVTLIPPRYKVTKDNPNIVTLYPFKHTSSVNIPKSFILNYASSKNIIPIDNKQKSEVIDKLLPKNVTTYGLRYSTDNNNNIPCFSIIGYQIETDTQILDPTVEYIIDIYDGKMIFNDSSNNRMVYLNFTYNESTNLVEISTNVIYSGEPFQAISFYNGENSSVNADTHFYHFRTGKDYTDFVNLYKTDINKSIKYNYTQGLKVHNAGEYNIDVLMMDQTNNIYAAKANRNAIVNMAEPHLTVISNTKTSNNEYNRKGLLLDKDKNSSTLIDGYNDFCIYDYKYKSSNIAINANNLTATYPIHIYNTNIPDINTTAHFINTNDKFKIYKINSVNVPINKKDLTATYNYSLTLRRINTNSNTKFIDNDASVTLKKLADNDLIDYKAAISIGDNMAVLLKNNLAFSSSTNMPGAGAKYFNINIIFYNELGNYPVLQIPGTLIAPSALNYETITDNVDEAAKEYILFFEDCPSYWENQKSYHNDIMRLIKSKYISLYLQPTWEIPVEIKRIDPSTNEMLISSNYPYFDTAFKPHEIIKLKYEDIDTQYYNYGAYEVVRYDSSENAIVLRGNINETYLKTEIIQYIYARLRQDLDPSTKYEISEDGLLGVRRGNVLDTTFYFNDGSIKLTYKLKAYNYQDPSTKLEEIRYQVYTIDYNPSTGQRDIYYPYFYITPPGNTNIYITYAHQAYVDYTMNITDSSYNKSTSNITISIENTNENSHKVQYIDDTFKVIYRDFDINNGLEMWMDSSYNEILYARIPNILTSELYQYNIPIVVDTENSNIIFKIDFQNCGMDPSSSTVYWKIYKRIDEYNNKKLLFESYNTVLYLDSDIPGIYDLEAYVYDKYGNTAYREFTGAYTIKG